MREGFYHKRITTNCVVYLAAIMEFLCAELLEVSAESCVLEKKKRIKPCHIERGLRRDNDFARLFH